MPHGAAPVRGEVLDDAPGAELSRGPAVLVDGGALRRLQRRVVRDREGLDLRLAAVSGVAPAPQPGPLARLLTHITREGLVAVILVDLQLPDLDVLAGAPEPPDRLEVLAAGVDDAVVVPAPEVKDVLGVPDHEQLPAAAFSQRAEICAELLEPGGGGLARPGQVLLVIGQREDQIAGPEVCREHELELLVGVLGIHPLLGFGAELPLGAALPGRIPAGTARVDGLEHERPGGYDLFGFH